MKLENIQRTHERKSVAMSIRCTKEQSKFMKDNKISPTRLFQEALKIAGFKNGNTKN